MNYSEIFSTFLIDLQSYFRQRISYSGASYQQLIAVLIIPDDGIKMSQLASKIGIKNSTLTRLINGLKSKNWIKKEQQLNDKRVTRVFLSAQGIKVQSYLNKKIEKLGEEVERNVGSPKSQEAIEKLSMLHWGILKSKNKKIA
jgi:DNA-binding MarR family transcriptional regulator